MGFVKNTKKGGEYVFRENWFERCEVPAEEHRVGRKLQDAKENFAQQVRIIVIIIVFTIVIVVIIVIIIIVMIGIIVIMSIVTIK